MKQTTFASLAFERKKKQTRRERFLAEMEAVVPWAALLSVIEPHYPTTGRRGRPPMPLATMLRIYFMQQWYALSDPAMEDALYEVESMRRFAGLELTHDAMPDETTILKFRHLLEKHALTGQMMNIINDTLEQRGLLLKGGTMVDATIIHAPSSTKNQARKRDPEMHQTKKGNQWYFGMKIHVGADVHSGLVHTVFGHAGQRLGHRPVAASAARG
jgi:IS5 family transposase